jgi:hypothetical protein
MDDAGQLKWKNGVTYISGRRAIHRNRGANFQSTINPFGLSLAAARAIAISRPVLISFLLICRFGCTLNAVC